MLLMWQLRLSKHPFKSISWLNCHAVAAAPTEASTGPIGFWLLNDKYGAPFEDLSVSDRIAQKSGNIILDAVFPTSMVKSVHFSGELNSALTLDNSDGHYDVNSFTVLLYIKPDNPAVERSVIFGWENTVGDSM